MYFSLAAMRCRQGAPLPESRGLQRWHTRCTSEGLRSAVLQVVLADENGSGLDVGQERLLEPTVRQLFGGALEVQGVGGCGMRLVPLHWSMSMLRQGGVFMVTEPRPGLVCEFLADGLLQGLLAEAAVAKRAARLALWFSATRLRVGDGALVWGTRDDIARGTYCFTDGAGLIDRDVLRRGLALPDGAGPASAVQVRMGGCKGVLQRQDGLRAGTGLDAVLCASMVKVGVDMHSKDRGQSSVLVCDYARRLPLHLNHQVILLLAVRGVPQSVFFEMMAQGLQEKCDVLLDARAACNRLARTKSPFLPPLLTASLSQLALHDHYFFRALVAHCVSRDLRALRARGHLRVRQGALLMGVPDFTGTLQCGEVFVQVSAAPDAEGAGVIAGPVVCTKNPCHHPGDVRILTAADASRALGHLTDVIVFPTGPDVPRPHPDEMSGSDLDGDLYWVSWDPRLRPPPNTATPGKAAPVDALGNVPAMDFEPQAASDPPRDIVEYFVRVVGSSALGRVSVCHKFHADTDACGAYSDKCLALAKLCSVAVDAPKTGAQIDIPRECRVRPGDRPEYMFEDEDDREGAARPSTLLQQLADSAEALGRRLTEWHDSHVGSVTLVPAIRWASARVRTAAPRDWERLLDSAQRHQESYHRALRRLMRRFGAFTEAEAITCELMRHRGASRTDQMQHTEELREGLRRLKDATYALWQQETRTANARAAACQTAGTLTPAHVVACAWHYVAHTSRKVIKRRDMNRCFVSFGWVAIEALAEVLQAPLPDPRPGSSPIPSANFNLKADPKPNLNPILVPNPEPNSPSPQVSAMVRACGHTELPATGQQSARSIRTLFHNLLVDSGSDPKISPNSIPNPHPNHQPDPSPTVEPKCDVLIMGEECLQAKVQSVVQSLSYADALSLTAPFHVLRWPQHSSWCVPAALWLQRIFDMPPTSLALPPEAVWPDDHPVARHVFATAVSSVAATTDCADGTSGAAAAVVHADGFRGVWDRACDSARQHPALVIQTLRCATKSGDSALQRAYVVAAAARALSPDLGWRAAPAPRGRVSLGLWRCSRHAVREVEGKLQAQLSDAHSRSPAGALSLVAIPKGQGVAVHLATHRIEARALRALKTEAERQLGDWSLMEQDFVETYAQTSCCLSADTQRQILSTINAHDVTLVVGPTGSGKSCLLPPLVLQKVHSGRYTRVMVTEPRRVAAVSLANTVAQMRGWRVGRRVGYHIGGDQREAGMQETRLLFTTNSICSQTLVQSARRPPFTHIVLDEVHIRSRYDDIKMAVLRDLMDRARHGLADPPVKLILMSATADVGQLERYMAQRRLRVGTVKLPPPRFKVGEKYLEDLDFYQHLQQEWQEEGLVLPAPPENKDLEYMCQWLATVSPTGASEKLGRDHLQASDWRAYLVATLLLRVHTTTPGTGRILCFLPGEGDIQLTTEWLQLYRDTDRQTPFSCRTILGRQTVEAQRDSLEPSEHRQNRVILLATDVIESCVTPADVQVLVDCLLQRCCVPAPKGLLPEPRLRTQGITRAEAAQRAGRAGRQADGVVYRLVHQWYFRSAAFREFLQPETETGSFEDILLQLCTPHHASVFTEEWAKETLVSLMSPPPTESVNRAITTLLEVGVLRQGRQDGLELTFLGALLRRLPMPPRHGLLLLNGLRFGCLPVCAGLVALLRTRRPIFDVQGRYAWSAPQFRAAAASLLAWDSRSDALALLRVLAAYQAQATAPEPHAARWCAGHCVSQDALVEADGHFRDTMRALGQQQWVSQEVADGEVPDVVGQDRGVLLLAFVAAFSNWTVRQRIVPHNKVFIQRQTRWSCELRCVLPRRRRRRGSPSEAVSAHLLDLIRAVLTPPTLVVGKGAYVTAPFATPAECLAVWHGVKFMPPDVLPCRVETNAQYAYDLVLPGGRQGKPIAVGSTSYSAPSATPEAFLVAMDGLLLEKKVLVSAVTELPTESGRHPNFDFLLYAVALGTRSSDGAVAVMIEGERFCLCPPASAKGCEVASSLRKVLEAEAAADWTSAVAVVRDMVPRRRALAHELLGALR